MGIPVIARAGVLVLTKAPQARIAGLGSVVELVSATPLDVPLYWQHARAASSLLNGLTREILAAARVALIPLGRPRVTAPAPPRWLPVRCEWPYREPA